MIFEFNDIKIKNRTLISKGKIVIPNKGICQIKGRNGTGKTMLLNNLFFNYKDTYDICLVNQINNAILKECNIIENITISDDVEEIDRVRAVIEELELSYILKLNAKTLSGGEKRIVSLLRAIVSDADIIFVDEPTNDLDYITVYKIIKLLDCYKKDKLFIIVSHDDRIDIISDIIYECKNGILDVQEKGIIKENGIKGVIEEKIIKNRINIEYVEKLFRKKYAVYLIVLLFFVSVSYCRYYVDRIKDEDYPNIKDNQVDIYIPMSPVADEYLLKGSIPISQLKYITSDMDYSQLSEYIKNNRETIMSINYGLEIEENENYEIYVMEVYDSIETQHFYTCNAYLESMYGNGDGDIGLDTTDEFYYSDATEHEVLIPFEIEKFKRIEEKLKNLEDSYGNKLKNLHIIVKLNPEYSFWDFIRTEDVKKLMDGNYYIYSNETINLCNQINGIILYRRVLVVFCVILMLFFVLEMVMHMFIVISERDKISVLRDYGVSYNNVSSIIKGKYECIYLRRICSILFLFIIIFMEKKISAYTIVLPLMSYMAMRLYNIVNVMIMSRFIKKIYNWRYRC